MVGVDLLMDSCGGSGALDGLTASVRVPNPMIVLGRAFVIDNHHRLPFSKGTTEGRCYLYLPVQPGHIHAIERARTEGVKLAVYFDVVGRSSAAHSGETGGIPMLSLKLSRDDWLRGLDAWRYQSTWVVEVQEPPLEVPDPVRRHLERAAQFLRQAPDDAVHAVREVRMAMEASGIRERLDELRGGAQAANLSDRHRTRLDRLALLRGSLWHAVNTAMHGDGEDFQGWTRKDAELAVRSLVTLLASL